jgi:hypothetical protein
MALCTSAGVAHLGSDALHLLGDHVARVPVGGDACDVVQEVLEDALAVVGVLDLGMPLHPVQLLLGRAERRDGGDRGAREHVEALGRALHGVAVAHPDVLRLGLAAEDRAAVADDAGLGGAVLAVAGVADLAAEGAGHHLEAVADAEHGHAELEDGGVELRGALLVHGRGTAREHDAERLLRLDLGRGDAVRHELGVHAGLAHAARDQLRVLRTEVDHENRAVVRVSLFCHCRPFEVVEAGSAGPPPGVRRRFY